MSDTESDSDPVGHIHKYLMVINTAYWGGGWHANFGGNYNVWVPAKDEPKCATEAEAISILQGRLTNIGATLMPYEVGQ